MQHLQDHLRKTAARRQQQDAYCRGHQSGGVDRVRQALPVPGAEMMGHQHVDSAGETDKESGEQGHQDGGGAHRAQGHGAREAAYHRHVRHIKQDLQKVGEDQRDAEHQDLFSQRACGQVLLRLLHSSHAPLRFSVFRSPV